MAPLQAEETLREHAHELSADGLYRLTLLATGDEEAADDARLRKLEADMRAGLPGG